MALTGVSASVRRLFAPSAIWDFECNVDVSPID